MWLDRKERVWFSIILSPALVAIVLAFRPNPTPGAPTRHNFEPVVWQEHAALHDRALTEQADRVVAQNTLLGKTEAEVREILGEPTGWAADQQVIYRLGPYSFGVDWEWLTVIFGADGRAKSCQRWHD